MRRILAILALLCATTAFGQTLAGVNGDCQVGGQQALTSGLPSTATQQIATTNVLAGAGVQASFPNCIVTVYNTGTLTKSTIYSDNNATPTPLVNPFVANNDASYTFFVGQGACYDITISSGSIALPYNRTLTDVCEGTGGGGGSANLNGTVNHVVKFTSTTAGGDSEGIATGLAPASWLLGLDIVQAPLELDYPNSSSPGTQRYLLVSLDGSGNARLAQPTDTNNLLGVADAGAGTTGLVSVATYGVIQLTMDNQTAFNDYVILGSGSQGHDAGATEPVGPQVIGRVQSVNAGAGTNATVRLGLPDVLAQTTSGGSGTVSPCATVGAIAYYAATGNVVTCDPLFTTDGAGNFNAKSGTFSGPTAGFVAFGQSSTPSFSVANSFYLYAPTSISASVGEDVVAGSKRVCMMTFGADSASAVLVTADIAPQFERCQIPYSATVYEIDATADAGTPSVIVGKRHCTASPCASNFTVTNLVSSTLTTAASGGPACSKTDGTAGLDTFTTCASTLQNTTLAIGDYIETVSATAGGTAKRMSIAVHFVVN